MQKFGGSFANCIRLCNESAQTLIKMIVSNFASFQDTAVYKGKTGISTIILHVYMY